MIPPLDDRGLLPPGRHVVHLDDIPRRFCTNGHRWQLWDDALAGLDVVCAQLHRQPCPAPALVLGGSFFSDKPQPQDIEATLVFDSATPVSVCWWWVLQQTQLQPTLQKVHRLDFYPTLPGVNDFSLFFQYVGPKTAAVKQIGEKDYRGVIQVLTW
jgi:hypothetical protein